MRKRGGLALLFFVPFLILSACGGSPIDDEQLVTQPLTVSNKLTQEIPVQGVQMVALTNQQGLRQTVETGARWVQSSAVNWSKIEPVEGQRKWELLENKEKEWLDATNLGLRLIITVHYVPDWAQAIPGKSCGPVHPEKVLAFARFMYDLVDRYSRYPYNVTYWQIWNEPDASYKLVDDDSPFGCWGEFQDNFYQDGQYYGDVFTQVYTEIKRANPDAQVLIGGLMLDCSPLRPGELVESVVDSDECITSEFLEGILTVTGGDHFDGISFHAYDYYFREPGKYGNNNWMTSWSLGETAGKLKAKFIRALLDEYEITGKILVNTETALLCGRTGDEDFCLTEDYSLTKSAYLIISNVNALADGLTANLWYSLRGWRGSQLVDDSLIPNNTYEALKFNTEIIGYAEYVARLNLQEGLIGHQFRTPHGEVQVIWAVTEQSIQYTPNDVAPFLVYDMFGNVILASPLTISYTPIYIIWPENISYE